MLSTSEEAHRKCRLRCYSLRNKSCGCLPLCFFASWPICQTAIWSMPCSSVVCGSLWLAIILCGRTDLRVLCWRPRCSGGSNRFMRTRLSNIPAFQRLNTLKSIPCLKQSQRREKWSNFGREPSNYVSWTNQRWELEEKQTDFWDFPIDKPQLSIAMPNIVVSFSVKRCVFVLLFLFLFLFLFLVFHHNFFQRF